MGKFNGLGTPIIGCVLGGRSLRQLVEQTSTDKNDRNHANHNSVA